MQFVMHEVLDSVSILNALEGHEDLDTETLDFVLAEAARFCETELFPLNQIGDQEGCTFDDGVVTTPTGFKEAFKAYAEAGWLSLEVESEHDGQALPKLLAINVVEMLASSNLAWSMYASLTTGAYKLLSAHGEETIQKQYIPKLVQGQWASTMCLTESHAGSDLGIMRTKAEPLDDGSFALTGQKIFISGGEHDLTENIVHLILAKLPDAPEGTRGISLFLVPKYLVNEDGSLGERNTVACGSIEHKMGINGNATCVLNLDGARGYLIGGQHQGLQSMFVMMNAIRLETAVQGLSLGEVSFQNALSYAKERLQGRAKGQAPSETQSIIVHADVRRMLLTQKALNEGARVFSNWLALHLDIEAKHPDEETRKHAAGIVALLTPVAKAFMTDNGSQVCNFGMQILGGHGYIKEWGMEQYVRDARIAQIYEGTNGIQALDLLGRKILRDQGKALESYLSLIEDFIEVNHPQQVESHIQRLQSSLVEYRETTAWITEQAQANSEEIGAAASNYLRLLGLLSYAYIWAKVASTAAYKLESTEVDSSDKLFYEAKLQTARFFYTHIFPEFAALQEKIKAGSNVLLDLDAEGF